MLIKKTIAAFGAASVVLLGGGLVWAQAAPGSAPTTASTNPEGAKLASRYSAFAGSQTNAESLVNGLRTGSSITLGPSVTGPTAGAPAASFSPATGKMGYGSVNIALSLAKAALAKEGITNPTPAQLAAALNGGTITTAKGTVTMAGILGQRSQGMGWGKIAQSMGFKLGSIVSASHTDKSGKKADHASKGQASGRNASGHGKDGNAGGGGKGGGSGGGGGGGNAGGNGGGSGGGNGGGGGGK